MTEKGKFLSLPAPKDAPSALLRTVPQAAALRPAAKTGADTSVVPAIRAATAMAAAAGFNTFFIIFI